MSQFSVITLHPKRRQENGVSLDGPAQLIPVSSARKDNSQKQKELFRCEN